MARALILVEGQTEEVFVREVLAPHLRAYDVHVHVTLLVTKRVKSGGHFRGGVSTYERIKADVHRLLGDTDASIVTTMLDLYGLPLDFPGQLTKPINGSCYERVAHIEQEFRKSINHPRFEPYISLHEFETVAFVEPSKAAWVFASPFVVQQLQSVVSQFAGPEEINEGTETAPSKRLSNAFPAYQKTLHGPMIALAVGIDRIRAKCPHFNVWLTRLESL